jgi:hypothetical protein
MTRPIVAAFAEELPPHYPMLKNSFSWRQRLISSAAVCEAKLCLWASRCEDGRWERNELRQFPEILGGGRQ